MLNDKKYDKIFKLIAICLIIFFTYITFSFRIVGIVGKSMEPTFNHGDRIVVNILAYHFFTPEVGDIVVIGKDDASSIKRIVARPGDIVDFKHRRFYVNDELAGGNKFNYVTHDSGDRIYPFVVPSGSYFVMGDNRNNSTDSRHTNFGLITEEGINGRFSFILLRYRGGE